MRFGVELEVGFEFAFVVVVVAATEVEKVEEVDFLRWCCY